MRTFLWFFASILALWQPVVHARDLVVTQITGSSPETLDMARDYTAGAQVYFDSVNAHGGVQGRKLVMQVRQSDSATQAAQATRDAIANADCVALFGSVGDDAIVASVTSSAYRASPMAQFAPLTGNDVVAGNPSVFVLRASFRTEADRVVDWFAANHITTMALVRGPDSQTVAATLVARTGAAKIRVLADLPLGDDPAKVAAAVALRQPQLVIVVADTIGMGSFVKAYSSLSPGTFIVGLSNVNQQTLLELAGSRAASGTLLTQVVPSPHDTRLAVVREHLAAMKQFRDEPPSNLTLEGFLAAKAFVSALRTINGPIDRLSVLRAMKVPREYDAGGIVFEFGTAERASNYADIAMVRRDGTLLQ